MKLAKAAAMAHCTFAGAVRLGRLGLRNRKGRFYRVRRTDTTRTLTRALYRTGARTLYKKVPRTLKRAIYRNGLGNRTAVYPENPIQRPPHPTVAHSAIDAIATARCRSGE